MLWTCPAFNFVCKLFNFRMLIFGSRSSLELLLQADSVHSDGTFKYVSNLFDQIYTIHGRFYGEIMPFVYMYLPNRAQITYQTAFEAIVAIEPRLNFDRFMTDFEQAAMNAISTVRVILVK